MDPLSDLNPQQRAAVTFGEGPLLIVAGVGTGKTTVITRRIAWLIAEKKALPAEILALTFTEKAAAEMEERVDVLVPYGYVEAQIGTFHAFCDRVLRENAVLLGLSPDYRILTEPENALITQYKALLATEDINLNFAGEAIQEVAEIASKVNEQTENIGARRLHTVMERLLEQVSFEAPDLEETYMDITADYVIERLRDIIDDVDLSRYIL